MFLYFFNMPTHIAAQYLMESFSWSRIFFHESVITQQSFRKLITVARNIIMLCLESLSL